MKACNPVNLKTDIEYIFDPLVTSNDLKLKKLQKYGFMHIKRKLVTKAL